ncbi:hypothetical protein MRX96_001039 [Rhipicephalus microplus]
MGDAETAFSSIKEALANAVLLAQPKSDAIMSLTVDTSDVVIRAVLQKVFDALYSLPHPGIRATQRHTKGRCLWPRMNIHVHRWTCACLKCQLTKIQRNMVNALGAFSPPDSRLSHVHLNLVGPLPPSQNSRYMLTCVDRFTRWPEALPLTDTAAESVTRGLITVWISRYGVPKNTTHRAGLTLAKVLEMCASHLQNPAQADLHYKSVCRSLVAGAVELSTFLQKISSGTKEFIKCHRNDPDTSDLDGLQFKDWAMLWMQVIQELRQGVKLKKVDIETHLHPVEFELTPYEMLLDDIRSQRYKLNKVMASRRKLKPAPRRETPVHDRLMADIRQPQRLRPVRKRGSAGTSGRRSARASVFSKFKHPKRAFLAVARRLRRVMGTPRPIRAVVSAMSGMGRFGGFWEALPKCVSGSLPSDTSADSVAHLPEVVRPASLGSVAEVCSAVAPWTVPGSSEFLGGPSVVASRVRGGDFA